MEGVAAEESVSGGGGVPRVQLLVQGELGEPEVVPPVQEALRATCVEQHAQDAVAGRRHSEEPVGHVLPPVAAVVAPACIQVELLERIKVVGLWNRAPGDSLLDVSGVRECVEDGELLWVEVFFQECQALFVCRDGLAVWFVGVVEDALPLQFL